MGWVRSNSRAARFITALVWMKLVLVRQAHSTVFEVLLKVVAPDMARVLLSPRPMNETNPLVVAPTLLEVQGVAGWLAQAQCAYLRRL